MRLPRRRLASAFTHTPALSPDGGEGDEGSEHEGEEVRGPLCWHPTLIPNAAEANVAAAKQLPHWQCAGAPVPETRDDLSVPGSFYRSRTSTVFELAEFPAVL